MMVEVKIQEAKIGNLKEIQNLIQELCKKENKEFDSTISIDWALSEKGKEYVKKKITKNNECAFIAISDGKVVGYLVGIIDKAESWRNILQFAELGDMFVLEDYRGLGIGTKLYQAFVNWTKSKDVQRVRVVASTPNSKAIKFYKKNGLLDYNVVLETDIK